MRTLRRRSSVGLWLRRSRYGWGRPLRMRRRRGPSLRLLVFFLIVAGVTGWLVGELGAVPERPAVVLSVYRHDIDKTVAMDLETYVRGVVAAEMPADFQSEALKAQAVAARTLALRLWREQKPLPDHPDAVISTDFRTHQAWLSQDDLRERWGQFAYFWRWAKISKAVAATRGLVMTYKGELIFPAYHASSGGQTEDSENYWSSFTPYLRSVDDPYVKGSRYEQTTTSVKKAFIAARLDAALPVDSDTSLVEVLSRFPSGRVDQVRVGDKKVSGRRLREALGLRSNWFDVVDRGDEIQFTVKGYGHGVGLSQYGANGMAEAGYTFDQILTHYYTGIEIVSWYE